MMEVLQICWTPSLSLPQSDPLQNITKVFTWLLHRTIILSLTLNQNKLINKHRRRHRHHHHHRAAVSLKLSAVVGLTCRSTRRQKIQRSPAEAVAGLPP